MPLVGIVDPSAYEREHDEPGRLPRVLSIEELLATAEKAPPKWGPWSYELLMAAIERHEERDYLSSSMLAGGCGRSTVLERREDYVATVDSMWASLRGSQVHRTLELCARPGSIAEVRFWTQLYVDGVGEVEFSCAPDLVTGLPEPTVWDYKVTENIPRWGGPWQEHARQLQYNRYVLSHAMRWDGDIPFDPRHLRFKHLAIVYLGPKGPETMEVTSSKQVPKKTGTGTKAARLPYVMSDDEVLGVEGQLNVRAGAMIRALESYPEWPSDFTPETPGFEGPPGWACPGRPWCYFDCLAKRYPDGLTWGAKG